MGLKIVAMLRVAIPIAAIATVLAVFALSEPTLPRSGPYVAETKIMPGDGPVLDSRSFRTEAECETYVGHIGGAMLLATCQKQR